MKVAWVLVPIVAGMTIPPFVAMNLRMASKVGDMEAAVVLHAVGTLAGLLWVMLGMLTICRLLLRWCCQPSRHRSFPAALQRRRSLRRRPHPPAAWLRGWQ
jgi:hypothetical protein